MGLHYVHRDKYSHYKRRGQFKQWHKKGLVLLLKRDGSGWLYSDSTEFKVIKVSSKKEVKFSIEATGLAN